MNKRLFERLVESMKQHGEIARGERAPSRQPFREVLTLEREHTGALKTGRDLLRAIQAAIADIDRGLHFDDASARQLLQTSADEEGIQNWLAGELKLRAKGRFHIHREAEVAQGDKPDIIATSAAGPFEVALEIKRCGDGWTLKDLDHALQHQLAENYLRPESRRHGILVLVHPTSRRWRDTTTGEWFSFSALISRLSASALRLLWNKMGPIEVRVAGIDAAASSRP